MSLIFILRLIVKRHEKPINKPYKDVYFVDQKNIVNKDIHNFL